MTDILIPSRLISIMMSRTDESICIVQRPDIRLMQLKNATRCALLYGIRVIKPKETGNGTLPVLLCSGELDLLTTGAFGKIN